MPSGKRASPGCHGLNPPPPQRNYELWCQFSEHCKLQVNYFFHHCSEPPQHADSKIFFIFFVDLGSRSPLGPRGSVSIGFCGARQFNPLGGGLARGLYRPCPAQLKACSPQTKGISHALRLGYHPSATTAICPHVDALCALTHPQLRWTSHSHLQPHNSGMTCVGLWDSGLVLAPLKLLPPPGQGPQTKKVRRKHRRFSPQYDRVPGPKLISRGTKWFIFLHRYASPPPPKGDKGGASCAVLFCGRSPSQWIIWLTFCVYARSYPVRVPMLRYGTSMGHDAPKDVPRSLRWVYMMMHKGKIAFPRSFHWLQDIDCLAKDR